MSRISIINIFYLDLCVSLLSDWWIFFYTFSDEIKTSGAPPTIAVLAVKPNTRGTTIRRLNEKVKQQFLIETKTYKNSDLSDVYHFTLVRLYT